MNKANEIRKVQTQGVHHITLVGADRQTSIDFWEGVLGMPFIFDQPKLDNSNEGHLRHPSEHEIVYLLVEDSAERIRRGHPTLPVPVKIAYAGERAKEAKHGRKRRWCWRMPVRKRCPRTT